MNGCTCPLDCIPGSTAYLAAVQAVPWCNCCLVRTACATFESKALWKCQCIFKKALWCSWCHEHVLSRLSREHPPGAAHHIPGVPPAGGVHLPVRVPGRAQVGAFTCSGCLSQRQIVAVATSFPPGSMHSGNLAACTSTRAYLLITYIASMRCCTDEFGLHVRECCASEMASCHPSGAHQKVLFEGGAHDNSDAVRTPVPAVERCASLTRMFHCWHCLSASCIVSLIHCVSH